MATILLHHKALKANFVPKAQLSVSTINMNIAVCCLVQGTTSASESPSQALFRELPSTCALGFTLLALAMQCEPARQTPFEFLRRKTCADYCADLVTFSPRSFLAGCCRRPNRFQLQRLNPVLMSAKGAASEVRSCLILGCFSLVRCVSFAPSLPEKCCPCLR